MPELYCEATGRWARLSAEALETRPPPVRRRLEDLGLLGEPDLTTWIPCRHRRVLLLPDDDALWVPVSDQRTSGGFPYRALGLDADDRRLWDAVNGSRPVARVAEVAGLDADDALARLQRWTRRDVQALQLRPSPPRPRDPGLLQLCAPERPDNERPPELTMRSYHLDGITDGATHFDDRETTVAHALAVPHPALGGLAYGARLRQRLAALGWPVDGPIVEVGCGTGELAAAWGGPGPYVRVDLSPELLRTQALAAPDTRGLLGDAEALPLRDASVPLLISNEILADLSVAASVDGLDNVGAWRFAEEVARVLAPGGHAVLTEFGDPEAAPEEARQLDHPEVSIHFGRLAEVATKAGLTASLVRLDDLLGADLTAPQLARHSWQALRARAHALGHHLKARAWTPDTLAAALPFRVEGLEWTTLASDGPGPRITRFYALLLRR